MIAKNDELPSVTLPLPGSHRVYISGQIHAEIRVPMREITLAPTRLASGAEEANAPVRLYDTSGPWGDPGFGGTVTEGLPALRQPWIEGRGDVQAYEGRGERVADNGHRDDAESAGRPGRSAIGCWFSRD